MKCFEFRAFYPDSANSPTKCRQFSQRSRRSWLTRAAEIWNIRATQFAIGRVVRSRSSSSRARRGMMSWMVLGEPSSLPSSVPRSSDVRRSSESRGVDPTRMIRTHDQACAVETRTSVAHDHRRGCGRIRIRCRRGNGRSLDARPNSGRSQSTSLAVSISASSPTSRSRASSTPPASRMKWRPAVMMWSPLP
jgi:hypothetical protein